MQSAELNGTTLEYEVHGDSGEPVLLIHGSIFADGFKPFAAQPVFAPYRLIQYHRRGYGGSGTAVGRRYTIAHQAADAEALLDHLGVTRAHVVGHSYGACIGLQLAMQTPSLVHSLVLQEPPLLGAPGGGEAAAFVDGLLKQYGAGDRSGALATFLSTANGPKWRETVEAALGAGAVQQAMDECPTFFEVELQALRLWRFDQEVAHKVVAPTLSIVGDETAQFLLDAHEAVVRWIPGCMQLVLFGSTHLLQIANPEQAAEGVARFLSRNPMPVAAVPAAG